MQQHRSVAASAVTNACRQSIHSRADHAVLTSCCDPAAARRLLATAPWRPGGAAASSTAGGSAAQAHLLRSLPPRPPRAPPPPPPGAALFSTAPPSGGNAPRDETASEPSKDGEAPAAQLTVTQELLQLPNLLSLGRLASAPAIAALILAHNWSVALPALLVSGASDWADGAAARRLGQQSVLGSYLDPLADKVLICCVIGALGYEGLVPGWVAGLVIARDVSLVAVTVGYRFRSFGWSWPGGAAFFSAAAQPMPYMRPLMISKVNTVVQLALVASCLTHHWMAWPTVGALGALEYAAAGTTLASFAAYAAKYRQGKILPASAPADGGPVGKGDV